MSQHTNRLIHEKSPYLLQHAHNPVDWYPWCNEAFTRAQQEHKLILLSVGYSTCHWCHVVEEESFENEQVAQVMNDHFVNIKVDREERPDIDKQYMIYVQASTRGGGWPMTVFLTPELKPVFGGTYFHPKDQYGRIGFVSLMQLISAEWNKNREKLLSNANQIVLQLQEFTQNKQSGEKSLPEYATLRRAYQRFVMRYDAVEGGFSDAPKFPTPVILQFLLTYYADCKRPLSNMTINEATPIELLKFYAKTLLLNHEESGLYERVKEAKEERLKQVHQIYEMISLTLNKMARGGLHDHIGSGFHRYSVDGRWHVPHFEKMLYDQSQLLYTFVDAYHISKNADWAHVADDIVSYVQEHLTSKEGGFYSAEDADSLPDLSQKKKKEGAFCVWTLKELQSILGQDAEMFSFMFDCREEGNVSERYDPHGELTKQNVLIQIHTSEQVAKHFECSVEHVNSTIEQCKSKLRAIRQQRPAPHLDDKIVTAWNGLAIAGLARGYQVLQRPHYLKLAENAAEFLHREMWQSDRQRLWRSYRQGPAKQVEGFAEDYVFLIYGLMELYLASFNDKWLKWALQLQNTLDNCFWDEDQGGYFNVSHESKDQVLFRLKDDHDGAEPSVNSLAAQNLIRLYHFTADQNYQEKAESIFSFFSESLKSNPDAMPVMLKGLLLYFHSMQEIVFSGKTESADLRPFMEALQSNYHPRRLVVVLDEKSKYLLEKNSNFKAIWERNVHAPLPVVHVCENFTCSEPISDPIRFARLLESE